MSMLQTGARRGKEGLDQFRFAELAEEAECIAANVFVRMLEIVTDTVAIEIGDVSRASSKGIDRIPAYQTRIISCFSLPLESCLGQIS